MFSGTNGSQFRVAIFLINKSIILTSTLPGSYYLLNNNIIIILLTVATIGMRDATLTQMENSVSFQVCVTLINSMQLEISLTAFIETSPVTATG